MKTFAIERWLPWMVFAAVLIQGASLGLTDDEAYYWVLAQRPALGYAFHPPAVALSIAGVQAALGWLFGHHSAALVRLPAAMSGGLLVALGMRWIGRAGGQAPWRGGLVVTAFAGLFALSWMIVPDWPLLVGWTVAFAATWESCFGECPQEGKARWFWQEAALAAGLALAILSKYSGVLGAVSALVAIWLWAPRERRWRSTAAVILGGALAAGPILWWNSQHEWGSILYQIRERHGDAQVSWIRYLRFWAIEIVLMGPALFVFSADLVRRAFRRRCSRAELFVLAWAAPGAAVFCLQPLVSEFKPHWAFIVWWPLTFALGLARARGHWIRLARIHLAYGWSVIALVWLSCQIPIGAWALALAPKMDVTNDLYGWADLRTFVAKTLGEAALQLPVVGSRYQTAAQAAFALGEGDRVTLLPRDLKAMDEWPDLAVSEGQGPGWPRLLRPVLYVADNRYDSGPEYGGATCSLAGTLQKDRWGYSAKTIFLWKCEPQSGRP